MGGPVKHRSGQMGYERYNCEEPCKVEIKKPPPCHDKNYKTVDEINPNKNATVAVGGVVFQGNGLQPCTSKSKECCESCSHYMALVDFKDKEKWSDCRRIFFDDDDPVMMSLVSMNGGCCILEGLMEQVIVTGKIEIKDNWWTFTEVQSICSLSPRSQEKSP